MFFVFNLHLQLKSNSHQTYNIVYVDEAGFEHNRIRTHAWSARGKKVIGQHSGKRYGRTSLIAGKRQQELLAPILFSGTTNSKWFNHWFENYLLPELNPESLVIMDNAAFHQKQHIRNIAAKHGHEVLFLAPYSPDFNKIEQDFAIIKKRRMYAVGNTNLDDIIKSYGT